LQFKHSEDIYQFTKIARYFLNKLKNIVETQTAMTNFLYVTYRSGNEDDVDFCDQNRRGS